jgi:hypothetical protein
MRDDVKKPGVGLWCVIATTTVILYVLSSGPARILLVRNHNVPSIGGSHRAFFGSPVVTKAGQWKTIYGPLDSVSRERFGAPLRWYWRLFPIPEGP